MAIDPEVLPHGRQFALTWGLTREFGGMTGAMLRRSRSFARLAGAPVDVLTFDQQDDYPDLVEHLRAGGLLDEGIAVRNLWDEVTAATDRPATARGAKPAALDRFDPLPPTDDGTHARRSENGTLLQIDRRRPDGTLALSDIRDTRERGRVGGRSIVLCDGDGRPVFGFTRVWPFYRWWLDQVIGDEDAFLLVDSKTTADFLVGYRNPHATLVHIVHNSHLEGEDRPWGRIKTARRGPLTHLEDFDAVVLLSERQRDDVRVLLGPAESLEVVPNSAPLPTPHAAAPRDPHLGVVLASLDERKRVDHAVRAVESARAGALPPGSTSTATGPAASRFRPSSTSWASRTPCACSASARMRSTRSRRRPSSCSRAARKASPWCWPRGCPAGRCRSATTSPTAPRT
ncbi:hypothetical protein GCM10025866_15390 [Naasia aerilata]|uniref:Glycosyltransferase n=1 Tax=Naasia aerilata TaxID=1162966 RepID=A0ABN6XPW9_9MICO|nr:hypothetical protein GCM10025866_15390 [Naasia aerilata]